MSDELLDEHWELHESPVGHWHVIAYQEIVCGINSCASRDGKGLACHIAAIHNNQLMVRAPDVKFAAVDPRQGQIRETQRVAEMIGLDIVRNDPIVSNVLSYMRNGKLSVEDALVLIVKTGAQVREKLMKDLVTIASSRPGPPFVIERPAE